MILEKVNYPEDLKCLKIEDKEKLAESALSGNKKDPTSIIEKRVEKVMDYLENSFENRRNRNS